jgi:hypothetical protein
MVGNMIHLLMRQDMKDGGVTLETPHATWYGAMKHIDELRAHWYSKGMLLQDSDSGLIVGDRDGKPKHYYFISSRTIDE